MSSDEPKDNCRCGEPAHTTCFLCKARLCKWHEGTKPFSSFTKKGVVSTSLEAVCYPDCTSAFGILEERGVLVGKA